MRTHTHLSHVRENVCVTVSLLSSYPKEGLELCNVCPKAEQKKCRVMRYRAKVHSRRQCSCARFRLGQRSFLNSICHFAHFWHLNPAKEEDREDSVRVAIVPPPPPSCAFHGRCCNSHFGRCFHGLIFPRFSPSFFTRDEAPQLLMMRLLPFRHL